MEFTPNQFVPKITSPLPCSSGLVRRTLLFIFSKNSFLSLAPLINTTQAFSTLSFIGSFLSKESWSGLVCSWTVLLVSWSTSWSVSQCITQSISWSVSQSMRHSVNQLVGQSVNQSASQPASQPANQPINQSINQSINQKSLFQRLQWTNFLTH